MVDIDDLRGSIKLDGETVFFHHISSDMDKLKIYKDGLESGKITFFDQSLLSRLRKMYYGFYSAIIYIFGYPTSFENIGNKVELLVYALEDKDYKIVHGITNSVREIPFFMYGVKHLDCNSWIEVEEGGKSYVYDLFSLMKFEKDIYYKLENPTKTKEYSRSQIIGNNNYDSDNFRKYSDGFNFMLVRTIPIMEKELPHHPFKRILEPEISRFKKEIKFDDVVLDYKVFSLEKVDKL